MSISPFASVIMSARDAAMFIKPCVDSILAQSFTDFELLIVDDGSTDRTYEILKTFIDKRIRLFRNDTNKGIVDSVNSLVMESKGEVLLRHDADDVSHPRRFERQIGFLAEHKDVVLLGTGIELINRDGKIVGGWGYPESDSAIRLTLNQHSAFANPTTAIRRSTFLNVGGYRREFRSCEDYDFFLRVSDQAGKLANLRETLYFLRRHGNNETIERGERQLLFHLLAQLSADRRREFQNDIALPAPQDDIYTFLSERFPEQLMSNKGWLAGELFTRAEQAIACGNYGSAIRLFYRSARHEFEKWRLRRFVTSLAAATVQGIRRPN